jgi:hypothetical protein
MLPSSVVAQSRRRRCVSRFFSTQRERERERENERERKEEEVQQKRVCDIKISRGVIFWQMQFLFPLVVTRSKLRNFV